ncbi:MAG: hypothetical protein ACK5RG_14925 [Cyclobacteriaceae bacterium]|jgi:hypothetical protein|nr:hypothetical protein [Flammeovirgaceae bacterium]
MGEIQEKAKKMSFYIALGYVGLGIISLLAMTSKTLMENEFTSILVMVICILTMPVSFLGFGILWGGGEDARTLMFVVQLGVFGIFWYATYRYLTNRYTTKQHMIKRKMNQTGTDAQQKV